MSKRFVIVVLALSMMFTLSGCIYVTIDEYYEIAHDTPEIESIALYMTSQEEDAQINELIETPVAEISPDDFDEFVDDLEKLPFVNGMYIMLAAMDPSFFFGDYVIKINYKNDDYELISNSSFQQVYYANGEIDDLHYSIDDTAWAGFLQKYFGIE